MNMTVKTGIVFLLVAVCGTVGLSHAAYAASAGGAYVERVYDPIPDAPRSQSPEEAEAKSAGCMSCHTETDSKSMHASPGVVLGCTDCHGGNADIFYHEGAKGSDHDYALEKAHVLPSYPEDWNFPHSKNPEISYTLLNKEAKEFVRFVNPSSLRVAKRSLWCLPLEIVQAAKRSIMATGAMLFGAATYANNILPYKNYILGEAYTPDGEPSAIQGPPLKNADAAQLDYGVQRILYPLPA